MPGVVIREVSDEIVPEESREEVFTCTASRSRLPASEREKSMKMKWEDISDADDKNTRCRGQIVSKKRGERMWTDHYAADCSPNMSCFKELTHHHAPRSIPPPFNTQPSIENKVLLFELWVLV